MILDVQRKATFGLKALMQIKWTYVFEKEKQISLI